MKKFVRSLAWCLAASVALPAGGAIADDHHDKDHKDDKDKDHHRDHDKDHDKDHKGDVHADWPKEAPPPLKEEKREEKEGASWIPGHWEWKNKKYEWAPGHSEGLKPGKRWQIAKWEQRGDHYEYVEGVWVDGAAEPDKRPPPPDRPHREWKIEAPTVSSYWPAKAKPGSRVVIRGKNFPPSAEVRLEGQSIKEAKVEAERIEFKLPADAKSGRLVIKLEKHVLVVGPFEVNNVDPEAEAKKLAEEQRKAAEAAWAARQKELAADRAARQAAYDKRLEEREKTREDRRRARAEEIRKKFEAAFLADDDTVAELTLHAQRVARIERMKDLIEISGDAKLGVRVTTADARETARHEARMAALLEAFKAGGAK